MNKLALTGWAIAVFLLGYAMGAVHGYGEGQDSLVPLLAEAEGERDVALDAFQHLVVGGGRDTLELVVDAIHGQESSYGTNAKDDSHGSNACDTAVGDYQVQPRTAIWLRNIGRLDLREFPERSCAAMRDRLRRDVPANRKAARTYMTWLLERKGTYPAALCAFNGLPDLPACRYSAEVLARVAP